MPPDRSCFTPLNLPPTFSLPQCMDYFTLGAAPNTDLWRKPPDRDTSTAPILFTSLRHPFVIAEVTVTADWEMEWDQGGLVIFAGSAPTPGPASNTGRNNSRRAPTQQSNNSNDNDNPTNRDSGTSSNSQQQQQQQPDEPAPPYSRSTSSCKWVKAGLEFSSGTVNASSVSATDDGADWCLAPLALPNQPTNITSLRIKLERIGHSLWVWYQLPTLSSHARTPGAIGSTWRKLREVTWFFWAVEDKSVHVGVYASRPSNLSMSSTVFAMRNGSRLNSATGSRAAAADDSGSQVHGEGLVVEFEDLEIY
ncbi:hypothetical protein AJ80_02198 [Polytolypa hystricis UAMH7299]|uniref:Uncharacterized protein n=1 Tax=Polytolypa hystricis (strain UAMH7299) TaxID=1447883 RepID=A0A2B7YSA3_POLH7|nr:hypothetical protein AJ80_02198 [Polytolypa hystricis UAMH7299]